MTFEEFTKALIFSRVIDTAAIEDADEYDDGEMLGRVQAAYRRLTQRTTRSKS